MPHGACAVVKLVSNAINANQFNYRTSTRICSVYTFTYLPEGLSNTLTVSKKFLIIAEYLLELRDSLHPMSLEMEMQNKENPSLLQEQL